MFLHNRYPYRLHRRHNRRLVQYGKEPRSRPVFDYVVGVEGVGARAPVRADDLTSLVVKVRGRPEPSCRVVLLRQSRTPKVGTAASSMVSFAILSFERCCREIIVAA